jgi:hypothetical protein
MSVSILPKSNIVEEATFVDIVDLACITYSGELFQIADRRFFDVLDLIRQLANHEATAPMSLYLGWDLCHLCEGGFLDLFYEFVRLMFRVRFFGVRPHSNQMPHVR